MGGQYNYFHINSKTGGTHFSWEPFIAFDLRQYGNASKNFIRMKCVTISIYTKDGNELSIICVLSSLLSRCCIKSSEA